MFHYDVLAFNVSVIGHTLPECRDVDAFLFCTTCMPKHPNTWRPSMLLLLRSHAKRP